MTRRLSISSTANDRLKALRRLRRRGDARVFLAEGHRQLQEALAAGAAVVQVYSAPELFLGAADAGLVGEAERLGAQVLELGASAFRSISGQGRPDGVLAVVERWPTRLGDLRLPEEPLLAVAHGIERPGNLGTIVRTAAAAGADALVVCDAATDVFHRDVVRGSVGTLFHLPVAAAASPLVLAWLEERDFRVIVATPAGRRPHWRSDYEGATALVVGSERHGVGEAWLDAADETVAIPMARAADSVNVAIAAGVILFEAARRRADTSLTAAR
jgi:RNA methyltransferase, TrmH family